MGNFIKTQNSFACGEVSPEFYALNNANGLFVLENTDVLKSGGLTRRRGLKSIGNAYQDAIIVPFPITESEKYVLAIYNISMDIYCNDTKITTMIAPWKRADLAKLQYAQRFNSIFFVHPDYKPVIFTKNANGFSFTDFNFSSNADASVNIPFTRFEDSKNITITMSSSDIDTNYATFTTNADFWPENAVGERLYVDNRQWVVASVQSATAVTVYTNGNFTLAQGPIYDWYESVFNNRRGWPSCVSFHQNRLVFGGTYALPNCIWMSKVSDFHNFDSGTGLDDEAIYAALLSAQHHQICTIVSSDSLQILTSVGEWSISNSPLTPSNVNIKQHTSVGSIATRYLPPQQIEGSTAFISESGKDIRELDLDALGENYNATDLCLYAKHLMQNPVSVSYNQNTHQLFVVMQSGYMAVLHKYPNTDISAWGTYKTDGEFKYVCVLDDSTYVIVKRKSNYYLEKFDASCLKDATQYGFSYKISAVPMVVNGHCPKKIRTRKISVRVINTKTLFANDYRIEIPNVVYSNDNPGYSGDLSLNLLGIQADTIQPLWTLSSSEQLSATILSVTTEGWYSI